jgi:hypothetical protein
MKTKLIIAIIGALLAALIGCAGPQSHSELTPPHGEARVISSTSTTTQHLPDNWLKGTLTAGDGTAFQFRFEQKFVWGGASRGGVAAVNPQTGERFSGQYNAMFGRSTGRATWLTPTGPYGGAQLRSANVYQNDQTGTAIATLTGDKGTIIQIEMQVTRGLIQHGIGSGTDNNGQKYQVQF